MLVNIICFHIAVGGVRLYGVWRWWCWYGVVAGDGGLQSYLLVRVELRILHCLLGLQTVHQPQSL